MSLTDAVNVSRNFKVTLHEYKGKEYLGKELLDLWDSEAEQAKQKHKQYEKANKPSAKKQKTDKSDKSDKADKADKSDGAGAKGAKAKTGTAWSRFLIGNRTVLVDLQEVLR